MEHKLDNYFAQSGYSIDSPPTTPTDDQGSLSFPFPSLFFHTLGKMHVLSMGEGYQLYIRMFYVYVCFMFVLCVFYICVCVLSFLSCLHICTIFFIHFALIYIIVAILISLFDFLSKLICFFSFHCSIGRSLSFMQYR